MLDESYSRVIAEWEHFAVLTLFDLTDFDVTVSSISSKLNININKD